MTTPTRRSTLLILGLVLVAAMVLRLLHLGDPSLWWDECITLGISLLPVQRMLHILTVVGPSDIGGEFFPPLYHLVTHAVLGLSHDDAVLRLTSVVAGTATIAVFYALVRDLFDRRAALIAAVLTACSVYQLHYSRELRPYSLFMLFALLSLWLLHRALTRGGPRWHVAYILATAVMCYTSYMGATNIAAQGIFTGVFLLRGLARRNFSSKEALGKGAALLGCIAVVGLCYLPWLPAYKNVFTLLGLEGPPPIGDGFVLDTLQEFTAYAALKRGFPWLPMTVCALVGLWVACRRQYRLGLTLLGAFAVMPVVAFLVAHTKLGLSSRYLFNAYYLLVALASLGLAAIVDAAVKRLPLSPAQAGRAATLAGLAASLLLSATDLASLPNYYRRETSYNKELADYLVWNKNAVEYLLLQSNRNPKLITNWYLPDVYRSFGTFSPMGYKRAYYLIQSDFKEPRAPFPPRRLATFQDTAVFAMGLVSTAPATLFPDASGIARYREAFTGYQFYQDCDEADNLAPDTRYHTLTHYAYEKPGHAVYRFAATPGTRLQNARIALTFSATFLPGVSSDSVVTVSAAFGDEPFHLLDTVTGESFIGPDGNLVPANNEKRCFITKTYDLDAVPGSTQVRLRVDYGPVANPGVVEVNSIDLEARLSGSPTDADPALAALRRAAAHAALADWQPDRTLADANAVYAFPAKPGIPQGPANPAEALPAFLAAHPGIEPVFVIPGADGSPAYLFYDPALIDPFIRLTEDHAKPLRLGRKPPVEFQAVKLSGAFNRPRLSVGDVALPVPVLVPGPSMLLLNQNGEGVLRFEPSFSREQEALAAFPIAYNMKKNDDEDCLSCKEAAPCSVTVPISSDYPIRLLRIASYPRIFADKAGKNAIRIEFSPDGNTFTTLDTVASSRSGHWEGLMVRRISELRFDRPINNGFVRFSFSGPGTQLWSRDDRSMRIEALLDARSFPGLVVHDGDFAMTLTDNKEAPISVFLSPLPLPYLPRLQDHF